MEPGPFLAAPPELWLAIAAVGAVGLLILTTQAVVENWKRRR